MNAGSAFVTLLLTFEPVIGGYYGNYHCEAGRDVMVHLFEWTWESVAEECETFLGPNDYCGVQVSQPSEHRIVVGDQGYKDYPWWQRYQPVSYILESRSGNTVQFADMVTRCNNVGVRIYVDAVVNHMTGGGSGIGSAGSYFDADIESFPGVPFSQQDFHGPAECPTPDLNIHDYTDFVQLRFCRLSGLRDLRHSSGYVRNTIVDYLNSLVVYGVAGFRLDAAKHMLPEDIEDIWDRLFDLSWEWFPQGTRPYLFMEVIDMGSHEAVRGFDYVHVGRVCEFKYSINIGECFRKQWGQKISYLRNFGASWGFVNGLDAVVFIDNHDSQRGHGAGGLDTILTHFDPKLYKMASAFKLAWDYGHVRVMSSYQWPRNIIDGKDENDWVGPPSNPPGVTERSVCFNKWICEHRWRQIKNMVKFHNAALGQPVQNWWDNGEHAIAFSRGNRGFIVINNENYDIFGQFFQTGLPSGEYCDVINCENNRPPCGTCEHSRFSTFTVGEGGWAQIDVAADNDPFVAIHV